MDFKDLLSRIDGIAEAANPAQQAAIAINMKRHHQKPKNEGSMSDAENNTIGPKFGGYWKGTDPNPPKPGMGVGGESVLRDYEQILKEPKQRTAKDLMREYQEFKEQVIEDIDVFGIHMEALREHLANNPALYESREDYKNVRNFLKSHSTPNPTLGQKYVYVSVVATPLANALHLAHFSNLHTLLALQNGKAIFDINGDKKTYPESGKITGDSFIQVYFFSSVKEFMHFKTMFTLKFSESHISSKSLDSESSMNEDIAQIVEYGGVGGYGAASQAPQGTDNQPDPAKLQKAADATQIQKSTNQLAPTLNAQGAAQPVNKVKFQDVMNKLDDKSNQELQSNDLKQLQPLAVAASKALQNPQTSSQLKQVITKADQLDQQKQQQVKQAQQKVGTNAPAGQQQPQSTTPSNQPSAGATK